MDDKNRVQDSSLDKVVGGFTQYDKEENICKDWSCKFSRECERILVMVREPSVYHQGGWKNFYVGQKKHINIRNMMNSPI